MASFDGIWEQIHQEMEWGKYPSEEAVRFVARNYYQKNRSMTRLLDAGCGSGAGSWFMAREGFDVYAFDGSATAINKARQRMEQEGLQISLSVSDAMHLTYANAFFDGIIDSAMLSANTLESIAAILLEFHRVLKKGGRFFSSGLFKVGMTGYGTGEKLEEHSYREISEGSLAHRGTIHFFDEHEIRILWSQAGFKIIHIDSLDRTDLGGTNKVSYFMVEAEK